MSKREGADILRLGKKSYVSMSGIAGLCNDIKREGMPEASSRSSQYRARKAMCRQQTDYGRIVETVDGFVPDVTLGVQNPAAMLFVASQSEGFAALMTKTLQQHAMPWHFVIYADGITPQDGLSKHDGRKVQAIYYSFAEFGEEVLYTTEAWLVLCCVREKKLQKKDGYLSVLMTDLFERFFFNSAGGVNFMTTGIHLVLPHGTVQLRAVLNQAIADAPALKDIFHCKGHSGFRPCSLKCRNCTLRMYYDVESAAPTDVPHTCVDLARFKRTTNASIRETLAWLSAKPAADYEECSIAAGWNYHPRMFTLQPYVDASVMAAYDPQHVYCQGIVESEFGQLMYNLSKLRRDDCKYASIGAYVDGWKWPARFAATQAKFRKLFTPEAARNNLKTQSFSSSASEQLSLLPVLAHYFLVVVLGHVDEATTKMISCFLALVDVVLLVFATDRGKICPDTLERMILHHLTLFLAAYGEASFLPKHHFSTHFPDQLRRFGWLMRCFVHERNHMLPKIYAQSRKNTKSYEIGLMEDITIKQLQNVETVWFGARAPYWVKPRQATKRTLREMHPTELEPMVGNDLRTAKGENMKVGDACMFERGGEHLFGELVLLYRACGQDFAVVFEWEPCEEQPHVDSRRLLARQSPVQLPMAALKMSVIASAHVPDGVVVVILPILFR